MLKILLTLAMTALLGVAAGLSSPEPSSAAPASSEPSRPTHSLPQEQAEQQSAAAAAASSSSVTLLRGLDVPVRSREESEVTEETRTVSYEAYYDWDFGKLTLVSETGDIAALEPPRNWDMRTALSAHNDLVSLCFRPSTGVAFLLDDDQEWEMVKEPEGNDPPTLGEYEITLAVNDENNMSAVRFDYLSGRSWRLEEDGWEPIAGNLPDWPPTPK